MSRRRADKDNGELKLKLNDTVDSYGAVCGVDLNESLLKRLSLFAKPSSSSSLAGYDLPDKMSFKAHLRNKCLQAMILFGLLMQILSFGMTPKTRRLPKPGEMMLSMHRSPLGVFKEDHNMGAICYSFILNS
ncbi:unnamed protein product [Cochlearia groenlandica]